MLDLNLKLLDLVTKTIIIYLSNYLEMSVSISTFIHCNRIVKEDWEDREYLIHLKKVLKFFDKKF